MERPWIFLQNPFLSATNDSFRSCKKLGDFTIAALTAPDTPPFSDMHAELAPFSSTYNTAYTAWTAQRGMQKGKTSSLKDRLKALSSEKIENWDIAIQQVYKQGTPQYISLR